MVNPLDAAADTVAPWSPGHRPLKNPFWQYSRDKIAWEDLLFEAYRSDDFPVTVVHGDGTSLWTHTHARDFAKAFVGLLGRPQAVGESYAIASDEYLPWNQIYGLFARAAGVAQDWSSGNRPDPAIYKVLNTQDLHCIKWAADFTNPIIGGSGDQTPHH